MAQLRQIEEIPEPYTSLFKMYPSFNRIQSEVYDDLLYSSASVVITAPTGSGKTVLFEIALVNLFMRHTEYSAIKAVYVAPVKALCNERCADWSQRFGPLGISCIEVTGDSIEDLDLREFQIIVTTPEKWDSLTRRWRDKNSLVPTVKLLMIDEVHLIRDEKRGPVLESIVCRMKTMMRLQKSEGSVRFIAVSATIYNIEDLASWLGSQEKPAVFHRFGNESRPVILNRIVKGFPQGKTQRPYLYDIHLSYKLKPLLLNHAEGKPVLIFCSTRRGVVQTSQVLSQNLCFTFSAEHTDQLVNACKQITDTKLRALTISGIGYHHAGVGATDRNIVQNLFMKSLLPVLVATSTLAMGVNLPAHLVIIKSTHQYVSGRVEEYPESTVLQMVGRAGRPQFDSSATAIILTRPEMVNRYERLMDCKEVLESSLHLQLAEHLNSEIVLLTIGDLSVAMDWLRCTFLYQRAIKNPKYYGIGAGTDNIHRIEKDLETMVIREINALKQEELVELSENGMDVMPTANGNLMSYYYIHFHTFKLFSKVLATATVNDLLCLLSDSVEFADIQLRVNERRTLNELNQCKAKDTIRFPMKGKISTPAMKVNCLVQAFLGCLDISESSLVQEGFRAISALERICRCLTQYLQKKGWYVAYLSALTLAKCLHARLWENSIYVSRQLERIGPSLSAMLVGCGKTSFQALEESSAQELERILNRAPPFGSFLQDKIRHLPRYEIDVQIDRRGLSECVLTIALSIENAVLVSRNNTTGNHHSLTLVVGDTDNRLLHCRKVPDSTLLTNPLHITQTLRSSLPQRVFISVISNQWVGLDVYRSVMTNPMVGSSVNMDTHISFKVEVARVTQKQAKKKNTPDGRPTQETIGGRLTQKKSVPSQVTDATLPLDNSLAIADETGTVNYPNVVLETIVPDDSPPLLSQTSYNRALKESRNITFDLYPTSLEYNEECLEILKCTDEVFNHGLDTQVPNEMDDCIAMDVLPEKTRTSCSSSATGLLECFIGNDEPPINDQASAVAELHSNYSLNEFSISADAPVDYREPNTHSLSYSGDNLQGNRTYVTNAMHNSMSDCMIEELVDDPPVYTNLVEEPLSLDGYSYTNDGNGAPVVSCNNGAQMSLNYFQAISDKSELYPTYQKENCFSFENNYATDEKQLFVPPTDSAADGRSEYFVDNSNATIKKQIYGFAGDTYGSCEKPRERSIAQDYFYCNPKSPNLEYKVPSAIEVEDRESSCSLGLNIPKDAHQKLPKRNAYSIHQELIDKVNNVPSREEGAGVVTELASPAAPKHLRNLQQENSCKYVATEILEPLRENYFPSNKYTSLCASGVHNIISNIGNKFTSERELIQTPQFGNPSQPSSPPYHEMSPNYHPESAPGIAQDSVSDSSSHSYESEITSHYFKAPVPCQQFFQPTQVSNGGTPSTSSNQTSAGFSVMSDRKNVMPSYAPNNFPLTDSPHRAKPYTITHRFSQQPSTYKKIHLMESADPKSDIVPYMGSSTQKGLFYNTSSLTHSADERSCLLSSDITQQSSVTNADKENCLPGVLSLKDMLQAARESKSKR